MNTPAPASGATQRALVPGRSASPIVTPSQIAAHATRIARRPKLWCRWFQIPLKC